MNWTALISEEQVENIREESKTQPVVIFKHSTTCNISQMALGRLERNWKSNDATPIKGYFLDLRAYRNVSQYVASFFDVEHQSPQIIVIRNGEVTHVSSHMDINFADIKTAAEAH